MKNMSYRAVLALGLLVMMIEPGHAQPGGRRGPEVVSPEVLPDGKVAFRLLARQAESVRLVSPDLGGQGALTKNDQGVWELALGPIDPPRVIRYRFDVDGVLMTDVFSSGIFGINRDQGDGPTWEEQHLAVLKDPDLKEDLELFWFATGRDDFLIDVSRDTVALFKKHGLT